MSLPMPEAVRLRAAAILDDIRGPAVRFRFHQLAPYLERLGIDLERWCTPTTQLRGPSWPPARQATVLANLALTALLKVPGVLATNQTDVAIVSRQLVQGVPGLERALRGAWVLDVDDALWKARPFGARAARMAAQRAAAVVAGNPQVADWYAQHNPVVEVIPTSVDTERYVPNPGRDDVFRIGWIGSRSNLPFLKELDSVLGAFLVENPRSQLLVVSDEMPHLPSVPSAQFEFRAWSPDNEVRSIQSMSVGLMPLADTEVARGKSAAKMLTYFACGVPTIASPVGVNAEILSNTDVGWAPRSLPEWAVALWECLENPAAAFAKGRRGRQMVIERFSAEQAARSWSRLLRRLVSH